MGPSTPPPPRVDEISDPSPAVWLLVPLPRVVAISVLVFNERGKSIGALRCEEWRDLGELEDLVLDEAAVESLVSAAEPRFIEEIVIILL